MHSMLQHLQAKNVNPKPIGTQARASIIGSNIYRNVLSALVTMYDMGTCFQQFIDTSLSISANNTPMTICCQIKEPFKILKENYMITSLETFESQGPSCCTEMMQGSTLVCEDSVLSLCAHAP